MRARSSPIMIAIPCAAAIVVTGAIAAISAQGQATRTLTFTSPRPSARDIKEVDVRPRGISIGDQFVAGQDLRTGGRLVGRMMGVCTAADQSFEGRQCVATLVLRDGQLTAQGGGLNRHLPGAPASTQHGDAFAVTGGTGAYEGATGTLTIREARDGRADVTVTLRRR